MCPYVHDLHNHPGKSPELKWGLFVIKQGHCAITTQLVLNHLLRRLLVVDIDLSAALSRLQCMHAFKANEHKWLQVAISDSHLNGSGCRQHTRQLMGSC